MNIHLRLKVILTFIPMCYPNIMDSTPAFAENETVCLSEFH